MTLINLINILGEKAQTEKLHLRFNACKFEHQGRTYKVDFSTHEVAIEDVVARAEYEELKIARGKFLQDRYLNKGVGEPISQQDLHELDQTSYTRFREDDISRSQWAALMYLQDFMKGNYGDFVARRATDGWNRLHGDQSWKTR